MELTVSRGLCIVNQTNIGTVLKATLGKYLRDGVDRMIIYVSEHTDTSLN